MASDAHILISLAERHADNIFSGSKQVELRRRIMHVEPGTTAWIYVKLPIGSIVGRVQVVSVYSSSPINIWRRFGAVSGLTKSEFFGYFDGIEQGFALVLEDAVRLDNYLSLLPNRPKTTHF